MKSSVDVVGLGMSLVDLLHVVEEFPDGPGVTESDESRIMGGGPVPTALCAASRLGANCAIIDRVGSDWKGDHVRNEYHQYGVDTAHIISESGRSTSFSSALVRERDGERHIVFSGGDFTPLKIEELPMKLLASARFLHLNGRHWPACIEAARIVRQSGGRNSFDGGGGSLSGAIQGTAVFHRYFNSGARFCGKPVRNPRPGKTTRCSFGLGG